MKYKFKMITFIGAIFFIVSCGEQQKAESISLQDVLSYQNDSQSIIVDTRGDSHYNGFKSPLAERGGHLPNAIQFSADWIGAIHPDYFEQFAYDKGITKDKTIIFYDDNLDNLEIVSAEFIARGYKVKLFKDFILYANNPNLPLEAFPHYELLVSAPWLKMALDGKRPETDKGNPIMVFHVSWGPVEQAQGYKQHIPGAYHFDTDWIENGPIWNLSSPDIIKHNLLKNGITKNKTIVLYSENQLAAFRVFWALKWAGVEDVRILNGGMNAWVNNEYPIDLSINIPSPEKEFGTIIPANPQINVSTAQQAYNEQQQGLKLISIRSWDEYLGKVSGYDYIPSKGEPAGAIWGYAGTDASNVADYYDPDGSLRNPKEIFALWETQGITPSDKLAFYCGTGWRAGVPWFITQLAGWENTVIYDGGWNAWQMDPKLPVSHRENSTLIKPNAHNFFGTTAKTGMSCKS